MMGFLRKLRGALGLAATWGSVWATLFAGLALVIGIIDPDSIDPGEGLLRIAGIGAFLGLVSGALFGVLLSVAERGKSILDLSLLRVALWGAAATSVFPLLTPADNRMLLFLCPIGATLATVLVAAARRAELRAAGEHDRLTG